MSRAAEREGRGKIEKKEIFYASKFSFLRTIYFKFSMKMKRNSINNLVVRQPLG
jgi:hypothetical protein